MTGTTTCPQCGGSLPDGSPGGPCPSCDWQAPAATTPPAGPAEALVSTAAYSGPLAAPSVAEIARHFPHLEVLELLGQGGMGAVYKARQPALDRLVGLKVLPPAWGRDPAFAERFTREARALARLSHANIVILYDFGQADGLFYFLMEYVDGANLRKQLGRGPLPAAEALTLLRQVCDGLQYAHEEGIVHRDIKPENILVDLKGRVKIADFGLAKLMTPSGSDLMLTAPHQVMGTLHYMAPEQMERPRDVDHRADIYSLGVVCYEMLTGELPIGRFELPSEKVRVDVRFDNLVAQALAKEPARRLQRVSEFRARLEGIASASKPPPPMVLPVGDAVPLASPAPAPRAAQPEVNLPLAYQIVKGPARGLLAVGVVYLIMLLLVVTGQFATWLTDANININIGSSLGIPLVGAAILMILGGVRMQRLESYTLVKISSIVALIPHPCCALSLPIGIWALTTLNRPEVRRAFEFRSPRFGQPL